MLRRRLVLCAALAALVVPGAAAAKVDGRCSTMTMTSAVTGHVEDALGAPVGGVAVELTHTNSSTPAYGTTTDAAGDYLICAGRSDASDHNTWNVQVLDRRGKALYGAANQVYTTYTSPADDADFTRASGLPLRYMLNLTITPSEISTASGARDVEWIVRSKAPAATEIRLSLDHPDDGEGATIVLGAPTQEAGGPDDGGWNVWRHEDTFDEDSFERLYWADVRGFSGGEEITQADRQPYTIDNSAPILGPATAQDDECGPGTTAGAFSPAAPAGTTNPMPVVTLGACDRWVRGTRSGLDPFTLMGWICDDPGLSVGCRRINPVLNVYTIVWLPSEPLALGDYYFRFEIADYAGNRVTNTSGFLLHVTDSGGQRPRFQALSPGNLGSGNTAGIVIGSGLTNPSSIPTIGFQAKDADGQRDLVPGSLDVRVYYGDEQTLVYRYDPALPPNAHDALTGRGGATFDLSSGQFKATGYGLQGKPPGRYIATASITDHGGNSVTIAWHWVLVAAA